MMSIYSKFSKTNTFKSSDVPSLLSKNESWYPNATYLLKVIVPIAMFLTLWLSSGFLSRRNALRNRNITALSAWVWASICTAATLVLVARYLIPSLSGDDQENAASTENGILYLALLGCVLYRSIYFTLYIFFSFEASRRDPSLRQEETLPTQGQLSNQSQILRNPGLFFRGDRNALEISPEPVDPSSNTP